MSKHTINFVREKETRNTVRFVERAEKGKPPIIGTLYIQKWAAEDAQTVSIVLSIGE